MKTSILASLAFAAVLVPSLASAASVLSYDPSADSNHPRFVESTVDAKVPVFTEANKADTAVVTAYDPSAGNNDPRFVSVEVAKNSQNAAAIKADADRYAAASETGALIGTHGSTGARVVTSYDPSADSNHPRFVDTVILSK